MVQIAADVSIGEDPLTYLPRKPVQEFRKDRIIYSLLQPCERLYLVVLGRVKVSARAEDGYETTARIVCAEGLFGEAVLAGGNPRESAIALDTTSLMCWTREEIEQQIEREPHLGIALAQYFVQQGIALQDRIESMAAHKTPERIMIALIQLAHTLGAPLPDGFTRLAWLTHRTIGEYVGTSREIVTFQMNRLKRQGLIRYSRRYIDVHLGSIEKALRHQGIQVRQHFEERARAATSNTFF